MFAVLQGFGVGMGLIIAIGPQNAFVISQGLKQHHVFISALVCSLADVILITAGVAGLGSILVLHPLLIEIARWFGAIFLTLYSLKSFRSACHPDVLTNKSLDMQPASVKKIVIVLLGLSFLNPHAYLDTVVLIGSLAAQHSGSARPLFGIGAILASFTWFFSIAYGARRLTPLFKKPVAWRVLDIIIGVIMLVIAATLVLA